MTSYKAIIQTDEMLTSYKLNSKVTKALFGEAIEVT